jgi:transglutaminase-like putative cysteine protease
MPALSAGASLRRLLTPFVRFAAHLVTPESAWERVPMVVPAGAFGPGSHKPFAAYFDGTSSVSVQSIEDIVAWLQSCEYVSDVDLFHERDLWQHPTTFETLRRGDCEDFALWAWRKLAEVGIDAEFYVGRVVCDDTDADRQHAWVVFRVGGTAYLFEPAARTPSRMIRPLVDAMSAYVPHFAVNHRFDTNAFAGCAFDLRRSHAAGRRRPFDGA